jgi:hypothetical protein
LPNADRLLKNGAVFTLGTSDARSARWARF